MQLNPLNVLNLLITLFKAMNIPETPVTIEEQKFTKGLQGVLMDAMMDFITPEYVLEDELAFQEQFKDWKYIAVDDSEEFDVYEYLQYIKKDDEDDKSVEGKIMRG